MDLLLQTVTSLASARTLAEVTGIVRQTARALLQADGVTFVLREGEHCYYAEEDAIGPLWKGRRFPLESCVSGWTMIHRQIAAIVDIYADPRVPAEAYRPTFVKSLLMAPVRQEEPIGAIGAYWAQPHESTSDERTVLQALANAAALALGNIELTADLQRTLAAERHAREEAEQANRLKDEFLATLSHELRTPLHVIQSWLYQLKVHDRSDLNRRALEVIERNTALQSRLVEDLLDVARATAGQLKLETQPVELGGICVAALDLVQPAARAKNIQIDVDRPADCYILADPERVRQILLYVLDNAVKFTPEGGRVGLRLQHAVDVVQVVVQDSGIGVEAQFLPRMFDRFRQAERSLTRRYGGLGLGLAIVKELTALHGGSVSAASAGKDRGTTITLRLPALDVAARKAVPAR